MFLFQWINYSEMLFLRRIAGVIVSLLLLQTSIAAAGGFDCASCSEGMDADGSTHGSMTMPDTPKSASALDASVPTSAPLGQSAADSHGAACISMVSCTSPGSLPSTRAVESPPTHAAGVIPEPAAMAQHPGPAPEVPPPRA